MSVAGATTLMNFLAREDWPLLNSLSGFSAAHLRKRWLAFENEKCYQLELRKGEQNGGNELSEKKVAGGAVLCHEY